MDEQEFWCRAYLVAARHGLKTKDCYEFADQAQRRYVMKAKREAQIDPRVAPRYVSQLK